MRVTEGSWGVKGLRNGKRCPTPCDPHDAPDRSRREDRGEELGGAYDFGNTEDETPGRGPGNVDDREVGRYEKGVLKRPDRRRVGSPE